MTSSHSPKLIIIVGQTASGKSDTAVTIAHHIGGEVVSADSRQVYTDIPIGSGVITKKDMCGVPHHMLGIVSPRVAYTAGQYRKDARDIVADILHRGSTPIIVGGTGFYIDTLVRDEPLPEVPPNKTLRGMCADITTDELVTRLATLDPDCALSIDTHNRRRVMRALEIATALGKVPMIPHHRPSPYDILWIGIHVPDNTLKEKISARNVDMIHRGLVAEVKALHAKRISWSRINELGFEFAYAAMHIRGEINKEDMLARMNTATKKYAKRQKTWFKRNSDIKWFAPTDIAHIMKTVDAFLAN
jgi:tRNA dimethylallyltransferase